MTTKLKNKLYNSVNADKFVIRFPEGMHRQVTEAAHAEKSAINSWIVRQLTRCLEEGKSTAIPISIGNPASWNGTSVIVESFSFGKLRLEACVRDARGSFKVGLEELSPLYV